MLLGGDQALLVSQQSIHSRQEVRNLSLKVVDLDVPRVVSRTPRKTTAIARPAADIRAWCALQTLIRQTRTLGGHRRKR